MRIAQQKKSRRIFHSLFIRVDISFLFLNYLFYKYIIYKWYIFKNLIYVCSSFA